FRGTRLRTAMAKSATAFSCSSSPAAAASEIRVRSRDSQSRMASTACIYRDIQGSYTQIQGMQGDRMGGLPPCPHAPMPPCPPSPHPGPKGLGLDKLLEAMQRAAEGYGIVLEQEIVSYEAWADYGAP